MKNGVINSLSNGEVIITAKAGTKTVIVNVTIHNADIKDLFDAIDDSNFINYQTNINANIWVSSQKAISSSTVYVDNNKTETQSGMVKVYTLIEDNTIYIATHLFGDDWEVTTSQLTEVDNDVNEQLVLSVEDFTKSGDYYTLKDGKAEEYSEILNDYIQNGAEITRFGFFRYKIKVTDGKIREVEVIFEGVIKFTNGNNSSSFDFKLNLEMNLLNYGSVNVHIPEKAMEKINSIK